MGPIAIRILHVLFFECVEGRYSMTAHLVCWDPKLEIDPDDGSIWEQLAALPRTEPAPKLLAFVQELLARYEDLSESGDTVWGDGPLVNNIVGDWINISLVWTGYQEAASFVTATAHRHGLDCYDAQTAEYFPATLRSQH
jgi:hypothetical protein